MWNDEEVVYDSIISYSPKEMFNRTLQSAQVFPRVYLFAIQQFSKQFNFHLLSLRLFPFICMITGFFIWLKIAQFEFKSKVEYLVFVLCWPASVKMVYYAAELKQYSMDLMIASLFILFLYKQNHLIEQGKSRLYSLLMIGLPALGMVSYIGFFMALLVGYNLIVLAVKNRSQLKYLLLFGFSLTFFILLSYNFDMKYRSAEVVSGVLADYFIATDSIYAFFKTLGSGIRNLFIRWFVERPRFLKRMSVFFAVFAVFYMFFGFIKCFKKEKFQLQSLHTIAFGIFSILVILGVLHKYPFVVVRTVLFFAPVAFFLMIKGMGSLAYIHRYLYYAARTFFIVFLIFITTGIAQYVFSGDLGGMPLLWEQYFKK